MANLVTCACGEAPILSAIEAAKRLGAKWGSVVSYAHSGQTALGDQSRVVGYGAVVMTAEKGLAGVQKKGGSPPIPTASASLRGGRSSPSHGRA